MQLNRSQLQTLRSFRDRLLAMALCWALIAVFLAVLFPMLGVFPPRWLTVIPLIFAMLLLCIGEVICRHLFRE